MGLLDLVGSVPEVDFLFRDEVGRLVVEGNDLVGGGVFGCPNTVGSILIIGDDDGFVLGLDDVVERVHEDVIVGHLGLLGRAEGPYTDEKDAVALVDEFYDLVEGLADVLLGGVVGEAYEVELLGEAVAVLDHP